MQEENRLFSNMFLLSLLLFLCKPLKYFPDRYMMETEILFFTGDDAAGKEASTSSMSTTKEQLPSPTNSTSPNPQNANMTINSSIGRKRPLLTGGPRTSMTPTKRTVMSLLARARAAQAKQINTSFQRNNLE